MHNDGFGELQDGFSSNEELQPEHIGSLRTDKKAEEHQFVNELTLKVEPPPEIKKKHYSLEPDIITGWAPKVFLPKPVALLFNNPTMQITNQDLYPREGGHQLCYLGPCFSSTYSAWKVLRVPFPYGHLNQQRIIMTDRFFMGMNPRLQQETLSFDSLFQCGNLDAAFKVDEFEYNLFMRVDANTKGHLQWFYFKVSKMRPGQRYRFNICNFQKAKTLYARGMKPYIFSVKQFQHQQVGWKQDGEDISYNKNNPFPEQVGSCPYDKQGKFFRLSFTISTEYQGDCLQVAYCPPYTYTRLNEFISTLASKRCDKGIITQDYLCLSLGGLKLPLLTITSHAQEQLALFKSNHKVKNKKLVFVMGRVHPGQCNGSFMVEGFISWLCSNTPQSIEIRQKYVFKILPMANPDGVVIGNYRTGLSGRDFNRQFIEPDSQLFVEVFQLKKFLQNCRSIYGNDFSIFMDFHGHTVKKNVFTYGPQFSIIDHRYYESRLLPKLIARRTPLFRFHSCVFKIAPSKESTARAVLLKQLRIPFAYTIQGSNGCYYDHEKLSDIPFTQQAWLTVGEKIGQAFYDYWVLFKVLIRKRQERNKEKQMAGRLKKDKVKRIQSSVSRTYQSTSSGSGVTTRYKSSSAYLKEKEMANSQALIQQIYKELVDGEDAKVQKCSDDELSQGRSDSQSQNNDLPANQMTCIIQIPPEEKKPTSQSEKKRSYVKILKALKRTSIGSMEEQPFDKDKRLFEITRDKIQLRKKIQSISGTPSPVKQAQTNTAKIINISFAINPLPTISSYSIADDRNKKVRTQISETRNENRRTTAKQDQYDSYRKTYLSLQRENLRKQDLKRKSNMNNTFSNGSFRIEEIVGRRIFTESSL